MFTPYIGIILCSLVICILLTMACSMTLNLPRYGRGSCFDTYLFFVFNEGDRKTAPALSYDINIGISSDGHWEGKRDCGC